MNRHHDQGKSYKNNIKLRLAYRFRGSLTPFSHGITKRIANEDLSPFEYVFCWLGNTDLLVSIIKLIEDKMNLEHDVNEVGVQLILLVEDGIRFYSSILPNLYKFVLKQSQEFSTEALNAHQRTLRMRGRPKIVLARTYEEAFGIYEKYKNNILGVITDVRFPRMERGEKDGLAGIKLCAAIRKEDPFVPLIIQSSESDNVAYAAKYDAAFIDKNSKKMDVDLRRIVSDNFGFGDFIFRNPDTLEEIARVKISKSFKTFFLPFRQNRSFTTSAATTLAAGSTRVPCSPWQSSCGPSPGIACKTWTPTAESSSRLS